MATRSMDDWLNAYGESHQNPTNKKEIGRAHV